MAYKTSLDDPKTRRTLKRLRRAAKGDKWGFVRAAPSIIFGLLRGRSPLETAIPYMKNVYIPVSEAQGQMFYQTVRASGAKRIVEFGTSFGVSAIYLCAALRDNGGGEFTGSEFEPNKVAAALANIDEAGLSDYAKILEGDAFRTLADIEGPIDFLLLDGWKNLCLPILEMLKPKLAPGAIVFCDDINAFKKTLKPYVKYVQEPSNGFMSLTLPLGDGLEYSIYLGADNPAQAAAA